MSFKKTKDKSSIMVSGNIWPALRGLSKTAYDDLKRSMVVL